MQPRDALQAPFAAAPLPPPHCRGRNL